MEGHIGTWDQLVRRLMKETFYKLVAHRASLLVCKRSAIPAAWQPTQATGRAGIVVKIVVIKTIM